MTRSDILNAVRDGACSKAFGEKCMALAAEAATHWDHFCASENERVAAEKERDDARREVEDLRATLAKGMTNRITEKAEHGKQLTEARGAVFAEIFAELDKAEGDFDFAVYRLKALAGGSR